MNPIRAKEARDLQDARDAAELAAIEAWKAAVEAARLAKLAADLEALGFDGGGGGGVSLETYSSFVGTLGTVLASMGARLEEKADLVSPIFEGDPSFPSDIPDGIDDNYLVNVGFVRKSARYVFNAQTDTSYTVLASDIKPSGNVIVLCGNAAAIDVSIASPSDLAVAIGDSVNVRQSGAGAVTLVASSCSLEGHLTTSGLYDTRTLIAQDANTWCVIGG